MFDNLFGFSPQYSQDAAALQNYHGDAYQRLLHQQYLNRALGQQKTESQRLSDIENLDNEMNEMQAIKKNDYRKKLLTECDV